MMLLGLLPLLIVYIAVGLFDDLAIRRPLRFRGRPPRAGTTGKRRWLLAHSRTGIGAGTDRNGEPLEGPITQGRVFRLAKKRDGRLTVSDVVLGTGVSIKKAEKFMEDLVDGTHVTLEIEAEGRIVYLFPEIIKGPASEDRSYD